MKRENVHQEWKKTLDALGSAIDNQIKGRHSRASVDAYFAMEHAGRAALALRGTLPTTHKGVAKALKNQLVRRGGLSEDLWDKIDSARLRRFEVEYDSPQESTPEEGHQHCTAAIEVAEAMREHLLRNGLREEGLTLVPQMPGSKPATPGGDPGVKGPGSRPKIDPGDGPEQKRSRGQKR